jgi:hypothetical protein
MDFLSFQRLGVVVVVYQFFVFSLFFLIFPSLINKEILLGKYGIDPSLENWTRTVHFSVDPPHPLRDPQWRIEMIVKTHRDTNSRPLKVHPD